MTRKHQTDKQAQPGIPALGRYLNWRFLLIARMNTGRDNAGKHVLGLLPRAGQGVNLALDDTLLHGVCKLLQDAVEKTDWDIKLALPTGFVPGGTEGVPRRLN